MSSPDTTKPHPYVKAHTQLVVSIYARGFAALGVIVFTPSFNSLTGIMFFALSTVLREGISYVARQSPAIVDELGYGSSLGSSMGLTLVWVLATVLRVRAKAATTWWLVTRIPHVQEKWKPLVDVFVSLGSCLSVYLTARVIMPQRRLHNSAFSFNDHWLTPGHRRGHDGHRCRLRPCLRLHPWMAATVFLAHPRLHCRLVIHDHRGRPLHQHTRAS